MEYVGKLCLGAVCSFVQISEVREGMAHIFCTKEKLDSLDSPMETLMAKKRDLEAQLDIPCSSRKKPTYQLQLWLEKVREKDEEVTRLKDKFGKQGCFLGTCFLNCHSRYRISRDAKILLNEINELKEEQLQVLFVEEEPPILVPASLKVVGRGIASNLDVTRSYLANETVGMVGIWGMGGVGKTTLLRKIYNSLLDDGNMGFDHVILVVVTRDSQLEKLHEEIAKKLQLFNSSNKEDISNALKSKNFVLLLDDIWAVVDLVELGIPHPHSNDNASKQYKRKVIFTTRSEELCTKMRADEKIKMECLEPQEAWDLFIENVNLDVFESDMRMKEIARQVMNECSGLPLTLILIGKAMSNKKNFEEWDYVLRSMRKSKTNIIQDVEKSLYPTLKISYDNLPNKRSKDCFLYISLWPRGVGISNEDIIDFWIGLGLIHEFDNMREAYGHGQYILGLLEAACLLEPYEKAYMDFKKDLKLHDVIHDMALWIVSKSGTRNIWMGNANIGLKRLSNVAAKKWRFAGVLSLMNNDIETLPKLTQHCPHLLSLMVQHNLNLKNIPDGFFLCMSNLKYLNLSETKLRRLPRDIKCLVNLQYLNISKTEISVLPSEMINLRNLQFLICQHLWWDHITPDGLVSKLPKLQVLDIYPNAAIKLKELNKLKECIKALGLCVTSPKVLQQLSELPTWHICLERLYDLISLSFDVLSCESNGFLQELIICSCSQLEEIVMNGSGVDLRHLDLGHLQNLKNFVWKEMMPQQFFCNLQLLTINECHKLSSLSWVMHLPSLTELSVQVCEGLEELFTWEEGEIQQVSECTSFPNLRSMTLEHLPNLVSMSSQAIDFPLLCSFPIFNCPNLRRLAFKPDIINKEFVQIHCVKEWWERLEWEDDTIQSFLSRFINFIDITHYLSTDPS